MSDFAPSANQLEISVFGPGVGECVVAHIGDGHWVVVDSCLDRKSREPIALRYLRSLGVDVATQVRLVAASHWHDDHIRGLSEVFTACRSAKFVNSAAHQLKDLSRLVHLNRSAGPQVSFTREFEAILDLLEERRTKGERREAVGPILASANKALLRINGQTVLSQITALSPSDGVVHVAEQELLRAMTAAKTRRRLAALGPNQLCVVLWIEVGELDVLLGADLEHVAGVTEGWRAIVTSGERPPGRARFFKVPHHGSENADCPDSWTELLANEPIAIVTPKSSSLLPKGSDIRRLCGRTKRVYLTSNPNNYGLPRRENSVERTVREVTLTRRALEGQMGHVRLRCDARAADSEPQVALRDGAKQQCTADAPS